MSGPTIICRSCGASNVADDQFCGSCGAFLEWQGEVVDEAGAGAPTAPTPPTPPAPSPPPAPLPTVIAPALSGSVLICPTCGIDNPLTRTFCRSCGATLAPSRGAAAATATAPVAPSRPRDEPAAGSGGLPGWLPIVAVAGVLVGIAVVVFGVVLRPSVAPVASAFPSATFTPTLAPTPPASGSVAPSGGPASLPPSVQLTLTGATASSVVGNREKFAAAMAIDGALDTCWQEGAEDEAGEWIEVTFAASRLDYVVVYSGYQLSHDAYLANLRPQNVVVSVNGGAPQGFQLSDSEQPQRLDLPDTDGATTVRIQIATTFPSEATAYPGSPYDDLAISEIRAFGAVQP